MASGELAREQLAFPYNPTGKPGVNESAFRDPAFMENRAMPVHRWVPWIAGFSAAFVDSVLETYLDRRKKAVVLDPFAGVGTTLIQSAIRGHQVAGFEINPYAALAAEAKLKALRVDRAILEATIEAMRHDARTWRNGRAAKVEAPKGFRSRIPFFGEKVEKQVLHALDLVLNIDDNRVSKAQKTC